MKYTKLSRILSVVFVLISVVVVLTWTTLSVWICTESIVAGLVFFIGPATPFIASDVIDYTYYAFEKKKNN